ncbi:MAG: DNA polymerase [Oscillospiraceae bacterium]|nr:DNA polymerase [Oscillospiraceae bacterium]
MKTLTIDLETRSDVDITASGVYRYTESPQFAILLMSVSVDGGEITTYDLAIGESIPFEIVTALVDPNVVKRAFNVNFERICLSVYLRRHYPQFLTDGVGSYLPPVSWQCDMIHARYLGLPSSLDALGKALSIKQAKLDSGKALIKYFCVPDKNGCFHAPEEDPQKWEEFKAYNKRDVEAEMEIQRLLAAVPVPEFIWQEFYLDQTINDRGILVDTVYAEHAIELHATEKQALLQKMQGLTGLGAPNSTVQLKGWLRSKGIDATSIDKNAVAELLKTASGDVAEVLKLHQMLSKSSVKKYEAMLKAVCPDGRARGMFSFYGACRTGRFSGRLIQLQNLPQNHLPDLETPKELIREGKYQELRARYDNIPDVLSQLIRTAFIPAAGKKFIVADFSAIEARVIAWLAKEQWRMDAFANGEDIYCTSASRIYGVPVKKNGINGELRQKGKVAELACAYGGSVGAMKAMGGADLDLSDEELKALVDDWRRASPNIVKLWKDVDQTAQYVVKKHCTLYTHGLKFSMQGDQLFITLPSGRSLVYCQPEIGMNRFGGSAILYAGVGTNKKWSVIETYGAKIVENIVQGIARDILLCAMQNLSDHHIVAHVHDEVIIEADQDVAVSEICNMMGQTPAWAEGLLLRADGYECDYYMKA